MKNLNEYETPETVKACKTVKNLSDFIAFAEDLERRLAMCRDALRNCRNALAKRHSEQSYYSSDVTEALEISTQTLKATEPK